MLMTPLIDVVFNLMIYFLLTMNFSTAPTLKLDLPEATSAKEAGVKNVLRVELPKDGRILVNGKEHTLSTLQKALADEAPKVEKGQAALFVDQGVYFGLAIKVMDALRLSGFSDIAVVAQHPQASRK
jgi:biopolymer transport protein ExbD